VSVSLTAINILRN